MSAVPELVKAFPLIPKHRLNDTLLSLVCTCVHKLQRNRG